MAIDQPKIKRAIVEVLSCEFGTDLKCVYFQHFPYQTSDFKLAAILEDQRYYSRPVGSAFTVWLEGDGVGIKGFNNQVTNKYASLMKTNPYPLDIIIYLLNDTDAWDNPVVSRGQIIYSLDAGMVLNK